MAIFDDFTVDNLSSLWTEREGTGWSVSDGVLNVATTPGAQSTSILEYSSESTGGNDHWAKVEINFANNTYNGVVLRLSGGAASSGYWVTSKFALGGIALIDAGVVGSNLVAHGITFNAGDVMGASVSGTGTSTVINIWKNPVGALPLDWGTPDFSYTLGVGEDVANAGQYIGLGAYGAGTTEKLDNFSGGSNVAVAVPPVLSSPTASPVAQSATSISGTVNTDSDTGALYWYVDNDAVAPSDADIKAGTGAVAAGSQAVSASGAQVIVAMTGLTPGASYYVHYLHTDVNGDSNVVTTAVVATYSKYVSVNSIAGGADLSGLDYAVFSGQDLSTMTILKQGAGESTDGSGNLVIDLNDVDVSHGDALIIIVGDWTDTPGAGSNAAICYADAVIG